MNLEDIDNTLRTYLNTNITDIAIKWENKQVYTLNSLPISQDDINALTLYIESKTISTDSARGLISDPNGIKYEAFFQITIMIKKEEGVSDAKILRSRLDTLFREEIIDEVVCERVLFMPNIDMESYLAMRIRVVAHGWG